MFRSQRQPVDVRSQAEVTHPLSLHYRRKDPVTTGNHNSRGLPSILQNRIPRECVCDALWPLPSLWSGPVGSHHASPCTPSVYADRDSDPQGAILCMQSRESPSCYRAALQGSVDCEGEQNSPESQKQIPPETRFEILKQLAQGPVQ